MESFDLRVWPGFFPAGGETTLPAIVEEITIDSRRIHRSHSLFIALKGTRDGHHYVEHAASMGCRYAIINKEWNAPPLTSAITLLRVADPLKALQEIAHAYRKQRNIPVIAIIGSHGKTMVKDLMHALLEKKYNVAASPESFNSQIGVPLSLLTVDSSHEIALIEAAFSKPNEIDTLSAMIAPTHTILTHIGKKHISSMGCIEAIAEECAKFLKSSAANRWVLVPKTPLLACYEKEIKAEPYFWNTPSARVPHAHFLSETEGKTKTYCIDFPDGSQFTGRINSGFYYFLDLINIAMKGAWLMGLSTQEICEVIRKYNPEPMRTEIWRSPKGTTFINDTYCSDPQSVDLALKHFDFRHNKGRNIFLFHGIRVPEEQKASHYRRIGKSLQNGRIDHLILIGDHPYDPLTDEIKKTSSPIDVQRFSSLREAYKDLELKLQRDDVVLIKGDTKRHLDEVTRALTDGITNNRCIINLAAVENNINVIRQKLPKKTRLMVMVKALAYGTDDIRMANFLNSNGIDILGVSHIDEAVALRHAGIKSSIFVLNAGIYEASKAVKWNLEVGVSEIGLIEALNAEGGKTGRHIKVHLHIDTGMGRFGCRPEEALCLARKISDMKNLILEGVMTHFSSAEDPNEDAFTLKQEKIFTDSINQLEANGISPKWRHAANSSAVLRFNFPQFNMARIGLAIYGLHASPDTEKALELKLALSLISRIVGINTCKNGESVSYGRSYTIKQQEQKIAVLPIGYFDGLHRNYSGKGHVIIRGRQARMVGRITMDYMMVDITDIPLAEIGDPVLLFGEDEYGHYVSPEDFAFKLDSIPHELITCLGPRIQRFFVYEEALTGAQHGIVSKNASIIETR